MKIRPLAIHLPQFHPIPENDEWWGKGFTEWINVVKAKPKFPGHYQPHLPADLGFYDLRLVDTIRLQHQLARDYGIHGFCYYHYWFQGKTLLETPLNLLLEKKDIEANYCICWANENWTRRWDGQDDDILIQQQYSLEDDKRHFQYLQRFFDDNRYIRVDGKPLYVVYRIELIPNIKKTVEVWRQQCRDLGIGEIYLLFVDKSTTLVDPESFGFDAMIEFQPNWKKVVRDKGSLTKRLLHKLSIRSSVFSENRVVDYQDYVVKMLSSPKSPFKSYPSVFPMWDNSARRKSSATIFYGSTPMKYESYLTQVISNFEPFSEQENFVFINAWNEWAEGNHLEPCQRWGRAYLEATKSSLSPYL
ncbi:glycosyltransferase WbsX family protein [Neolewinella litorea]|uniref:Glycosyl hydrolase n=1 Tax=Neolewinella litorea TaxID=2562452 RepID=A0A4S4NUG3_9BACT|nr:glycoside hydrolase family 99-like domain-containing protein [Neolewinella litorea]THH39880.1 glycosyl hydrolase [Neolewinella litorea]